MLLYNVTVSVDQRVETEWLRWMKSEHIPEVMATGMFTMHRICRLVQPEPQPEEGITYAIQYYCDSQEQLNRYFREFAPALQQVHAVKFGQHTAAFRTVLEIV